MTVAGEKRHVLEPVVFLGEFRYSAVYKYLVVYFVLEHTGLEMK